MAHLTGSPGRECGFEPIGHIIDEHASGTKSSGCERSSVPWDHMGHDIKRRFGLLALAAVHERKCGRGGDCDPCQSTIDRMKPVLGTAMNPGRAAPHAE
jgi:hypothetical protein